MRATILYGPHDGPSCKSPGPTDSKRRDCHPLESDMHKRTRPEQTAEARAVGAEVGRRHFLKLAGAGVAAGVMAAIDAPLFAQQTLAWDKTFPKSDRVDHRKVT